MDRVEETLCPIAMGTWVTVRRGKHPASDLDAYLWGGGVFQSDPVQGQKWTLMGSTGLEVTGSAWEGHAQGRNSGSSPLGLL